MDKERTFCIMSFCLSRCVIAAKLRHGKQGHTSVVSHRGHEWGLIKNHSFSPATTHNIMLTRLQVFCGRGSFIQEGGWHYLMNIGGHVTDIVMTLVHRVYHWRSDPMVLQSEYIG